MLPVDGSLQTIGSVYFVLNQVGRKVLAKAMEVTLGGLALGGYGGR